MQDNKKNRDANQTCLVLYHAIICMSHNGEVEEEEEREII